MLNIQHLTKVYGGKKAVDDLSLHIRPGEIYGFIGWWTGCPSAPTPWPASGGWPTSPTTPTFMST